MTKLYEARLFTKTMMLELAHRRDLMSPVLDVGPMRDPSGDPHSVFARWPDTYVDARKLFVDSGYDYRAVDLYPGNGIDYVGDFMDDKVVRPSSVGTLILFHVLEHVPEVWLTPLYIERLLKPGGRAFIVVPWDVELHAPYPDCWRISEQGLRSLFYRQFDIVTTASESAYMPAATYAEIKKRD